MRYTFPAFLLMTIISCKQDQKLEPDYIFVRSEAIEHFTHGNSRVQLVKSSISNGDELITDSTVVIQKFNSEQLVDQVEYDIEQGDSIFRRHLVKEYEGNLLISEIDSVVGFGINKSYYHHNAGKETRAEHLNILFNRDFEKLTLGITSADTMRSTVFSYYDRNGNCTLSKAVNINNLLSGLFEEVTPDTTTSYHSYDERGNKVRIVSTNNGDTTSIYVAEYNDANQLMTTIYGSKEFGTIIMSKMSYEYDEKGNKLSEIITIDGIPERTDYEYDSKNRVIRSLTYKSKDSYQQ